MEGCGTGSVSGAFYASILKHSTEKIKRFFQALKLYNTLLNGSSLSVLLATEENHLCVGA